MKKNCLPLIVFNLLLFLAAIPSPGQTYPEGFTQVQVASGMSNPTAMVFTPDNRILVTQQNGAVIVIKNGVKLPTPAIQLSVNTSGERGLIGITLHPQFATNKIVYLHYTLADGTRNRVSRFWMNGDIIRPESEQIILNLDPLGSSPYHNGGAMLFKGDKLYIAVGDNSAGSNSQNLTNTKGKILRINANGSIPGDNPFYSPYYSDARNMIWAYGLRNPFTLDIHPTTGRIMVNDVGQERWEEVNDATEKGKNFGWALSEGPTTNPSITPPYYAYAHGSGDGVGCAITGGVFFEPGETSYPYQYVGKYFFLDYCNAWINYIDLSNPPVRHSFATGLAGQMLGLDVGPDGNLYFLTRAGRLMKIIYTLDIAASIIEQPQDVSLSVGETATFSVTAVGTQPLTYQWRKSGADIPGATSRNFTIDNVQSSDQGVYSVAVTNVAGTAVSDPAYLDVLDNTAPTPVINEPTAGTTYSAGTWISFSGGATDPEEGVLPASALSWSVVFHHDTHVHDGPPIASGVGSGRFFIPASGEVSTNVFYRLHLTATDSDGASTSTYVDVTPRTSYITLKSNPPGLKLNFDHTPQVCPYTVKRVEGMGISIGGDWWTEQTLNGESYLFESWADDGAMTRGFDTPVDNTTYIGNFSKPLTGSWRTVDVGKLNIFGSAAEDNGTFTLNASGVDIWNLTDHFRYVYQEWNGSGEITARITGISNTHAWAKAGLMFRTSLSPAGKHASMFATPGGLVSFQQRPQYDEGSFATNKSGNVPIWLKLQRYGDTFAGWISNDGENWTFVGSQVIHMNTAVYVGLAYTSHNANTSGTATFTDVEVSAGVSELSHTEHVLLSEESGLTLYPNPVQGDVLVVDVPEVETEIEVFSTLGHSLMRKNFSSNEGARTINVADLPQGVYFVRATSQAKIRNGSFVRK